MIDNQTETVKYILIHLHFNWSAIGQIFRPSDVRKPPPHTTPHPYLPILKQCS